MVYDIYMVYHTHTTHTHTNFYELKPLMIPVFITKST